MSANSLITVNKNAIKQWLSLLIIVLIIHTLKMLNHCMEPLKNILYTHHTSITWKTNTNTYITQTITPLLTYHLCLSRKGCHAKGITKANHGLWNYKHITANYAYLLHVHCMIFPFDYYPFINIWNYSKPASTYLSPTLLYHILHIQLHECHSLTIGSKNAVTFPAHHAFHYSHTSNA